jgi:hypothetical protein
MTQKILLLSNLFLICALSCYSQTYLDKKIVVTVKDTSNIYQRVRLAFTKNNFRLKDDGNYVAVATLPKQVKKLTDHTMGKAEISGNTIIITATHGLLRVDEYGRTKFTNEWKDVVYMKGSKIWPLFEKVAKEIDGEITYSK